MQTILPGISDDDQVSKLDFLKVITKPFTKKIISIDKNTIKGIAKVRKYTVCSVFLAYAYSSFCAFHVFVLHRS